MDCSAWIACADNCNHHACEVKNVSEKETVLIRKCKCGAAHRIRYKEPYIWIECKKKCGMQTGFIRCGGLEDADTVKKCIDEWNKKVRIST